MRGGRHQATSYPLTKISAWVGREDWLWLQRQHRYDASAVLRRLIGDYRRQTENRGAGRTAEDWTAFDLSGL